MASRFWIKYASERSLVEEADLWDTPTNACPYLLLGRRHVPSRKVEATLCVKDVGHGKRGNCDFISMMGNSG
jgi:hypothetical protein